MINLACYNCGENFTKEMKEYRRRLKKGAVHFFCSISCGAVFRNSKTKLDILTKTISCEYCREIFEVTYKEGHSHKTHCSLSCASINSVTDLRREKAILSGYSNMGNLNVAKAMKSREMWKYMKIKEYLKRAVLKHEFEFELHHYIFDLAVFDLNLLVEFDGPDHIYVEAEDQKKDNLAKNNGWKVARIKVQPNTVISNNVLITLIDNYKNGGV